MTDPLLEESPIITAYRMQIESQRLMAQYRRALKYSCKIGDEARRLEAEAYELVKKANESGYFLGIEAKP